MLNIKWGIIAGGGAFILSLIAGGVSGAVFHIVLLRAAVFMAVFFALGIGCNMVITSFIPDLLEKDVPESSAPVVPVMNRPGSRINITLGEGGAVPEMYRKAGDSDEVGDIANLKPGSAPPPLPAGGGLDASLTAGKQGMDQIPQSGYTEEGQPGLADLSMGDEGDFFNPVKQDGEAEFEPAPAFSGQVFTTAVSEGDLGGLPDLDAMAGAFSINGEEDNSAETAVESFLPERKPSGNKPQGFDGDFNPKELAAGIRTVLEKEKKG